MSKKQSIGVNKLFYGDNLQVLRKYIKDESVDLCYIDPPFNSKRNYNQIYNNIGKEDKAQAQAFVDTWTWDDDAINGFDEITQSETHRFTKQTIQLIAGLEKVLGKGSLLAYLIHITLRASEIQRVLKPTGSFFLHCDPTASHYLKIILDSIFCAKGGDYLNEIVWERTNAHNFKAKYFGRTHDIILFYSKSQEYLWNQQYSEYSEAQLSRFRKDANGRLYTGRDLTIMSSAKDNKRNFEWRGSRPPANRAWGYPMEKLEELYEKGLILLKENGCPRLDGLKVFLDELPGKMLNDIWIDLGRIGNTSGERLGYPTQKPEALLERIIKACSNEGDVVLDAYCGCGTTVAVAERLKRKWIGIDITYQSISLILKRLVDSYDKTVLEKVELNGVPKDLEAAIALAEKKEDKTRKEFEKWCVLTYSNNRAIINEKKGSDGGIDGTAFINDYEENGVDVGIKDILFSVKSDKKPTVSYIRDLNGAMQRENAVMGYFITLYPPTKDMLEEAKKIGKYKNKYLGKDYDRLKIVSVEQILNGETFDVPKSQEIKVVKSAKKKENKNDQTDLFDGNQS